MASRNESNSAPSGEAPAEAREASVVEGVTAPLDANRALEHSQGGSTTRQDATDVGVPMLQGDGSERQGPEDALGIGPKRGDYSARLARRDTEPHESRAVPVEPDRVGVDPNVVIQAQAPRAADVGDEKGLKGGVDTDPLSPTYRGNR